MPQILPITDLRKTNEISELTEAEQEVMDGAELIDAREALAGLRRKYAK